MAIRTIFQAGPQTDPAPCLRRRAEPVGDPRAPAMIALADDLRDTLAAEGGIGLAAPQIGVPVQMLLYCVPAARLSSHPDDSPQPLTVLINPVLTALDDTHTLDWEACLSVRGYKGLLARAARMRLRALDLDGRVIDRIVGGFHARVLQHECDHLAGILYTDRLDSPPIPLEPAL